MLEVVQNSGKKYYIHYSTDSIDTHKTDLTASKTKLTN